MLCSLLLLWVPAADGPQSQLLSLAGRALRRWVPATISRFISGCFPTYPRASCLAGLLIGYQTSPGSLCLYNLAHVFPLPKMSAFLSKSHLTFRVHLTSCLLLLLPLGEAWHESHHSTAQRAPSSHPGPCLCFSDSVGLCPWFFLFCCFTRDFGGSPEPSLMMNSWLTHGCGGGTQGALEGRIWIQGEGIGDEFGRAEHRVWHLPPSCHCTCAMAVGCAHLEVTPSACSPCLCSWPPTAMPHPHRGHTPQHSLRVYWLLLSIQS